MDKTFERIIERLEEHEAAIKKRRQMIRDNYRQLKTYEKNFSRLSVHCTKKSIMIRIVSRHIFSCNEKPAFLKLVGLSNVCVIKSHLYGFSIMLVFDL